MGRPFKLMIEDQPVFLCCQSCEEKAKAKPKETVATVIELRRTKGAVQKLPARLLRNRTTRKMTEVNGYPGQEAQS